MSRNYVSTDPAHLPLVTHHTTTYNHSPSDEPNSHLLIGSWTGDNDVFDDMQPHAVKSRGVYWVELDSTTGRLIPRALCMIKNPSWLTFHPLNNAIVYIVNEHGEKIDGEISTIQLNISPSDDPSPLPSTPTPFCTILNSTPTQGEQPTHSSVTGDCKYIAIANYGCLPNTSSISIAQLPLSHSKPSSSTTATSMNNEGLTLTQVFPFTTGSNINAQQRQESGHAHCAAFTPCGQYLLACDLGADILRVYEYTNDPNPSNAFVPKPEMDLVFPPGSGPRHVAFSLNGDFLYVCTEMLAQLHVFRFSPSSNKYTPVSAHDLSPLDQFDNSRQTEAIISLFDEEHADDFTAKGASGILLSPDSKFLYVMNRGTLNQINVFQIDWDMDEDSTTNPSHLTLVQRFSTHNGPRTLTIDPTGNFMIVTNVHAGSVISIRLVNGLLLEEVSKMDIGTPTDAKFLY